MKFWEKLQKIDRRYIFIVMALAVIIPLLKPVSLPMDISPGTQNTYDAIESLQEGSRILISFDFDPASAPELYPASLAVLRHCFKKNLRVVAIVLWPGGVPLSEEALKLLAEEYKKVYGKDYINLGFKEGKEIVIQKIGINLPDTFPQDKYNKPISEFPIMEDVKNYNDFKLLVSFSAGYPGTKEYVMYANAPYHIEVFSAVTAVSAPEFYAYYSTRQLSGILAGMKGSAEYEYLVGKPGRAIQMMCPQTFAHLIIIIFVIIANISYFMTRKKKE